MKILVTGSAGHLGEALIRCLADTDHEAIGIDIKSSPFTSRQGSITEFDFIQACMRGVDVVLHTATLHKPHMASHIRQDFVDTNITGTLNLLETAASVGVKAFVYTSTTSVFGHALTPPDHAPATWITEETVPVPKNIYGVTKLAAEHLCEVMQQRYDLPCIVLRTSRFFPEDDDNKATRSSYDGANLKVNELLYRRADLADVVSAHMLAMHKASDIGFGRYIISATTPFVPDDLPQLRTDAPSVVRRRVPGYELKYRRRGWQMLPAIDRVYVNERARLQLGWEPQYSFGFVMDQLGASKDFRSPLARLIGSKGYHARTFSDGPYSV